ncbi:aminotransferase class III-fold pyridoxal phosphate-dependent enzyme [Oceanirhabdus sp. W0125-5]|uniref:aminotransferase class III-fold pyridoxal phosphate-dependent enzyme n=1 Tax=Oceanirhabdus sp. W0125-5 TaxID=2999116 RepID=UPI0022F2FAB0|nr:aminotransferase class III-fold pyridoxal phosphate-dependent enzyme [Oceanirhabdus sp. W0125-5]WBW97818.1 aminotransferase class III-fold pyridoxal phosphate-dependent enzyme [Oceanirhabdus sp. W0125-5]
MKSSSHVLNLHPIIDTEISCAKNCYLYTPNEKKIVDFTSGIWCTALGHSNEEVNTAMFNQSNKISNIHYKLNSIPTEKLATDLTFLVNHPMGKCIFLSSGSEAVELSIRIARMIRPQGLILTFSGSFLSSHSFSTQPRTTSTWLEFDCSNCSKCPKSAECAKCPFMNNIDFSNISTFVLESALAKNITFPNKKLVHFIVKKIKDNGGIVIANEVTTGLGRTGEWFGYNHLGIIPDMITLGKGLGNGYPISSVILSKEISFKVENSSFTYAQSHQNDPLGTAVGESVISIMTRDKLIERSKTIGAFFIEELNKLKNELPIVKTIKGKGLFLGMELDKVIQIDDIFNEMLQEGYFIGINPKINLLRFFPPLIIEKKDITEMCTALKSILRKRQIN